ncbi:MAG: amino acid ABC transporter ATP-binding protein [Acholeplasmatales bacterium]|jgi:putative lysine transport system ATP-binding protein|nr:amino acid ABC transporter ATP-binding protein [Acholeplasmataceae bacterium]MDY0114913.1 amino acid ABC transporter ATP-binding protein [Acholeplasmatales bacterium]MCK9233828.1 amino acid ABC transporter ATP-binding protein [Acholeplasmataceae bacterium]MCK9289522.1 amino acid ABC transporter ATP-binding protein [Acholeplasmataceae bacterium]MCK9427146.1 amino acid ABC transporter ATP-binding protein [Acholeplasmataceae bacterium]
MLLNTKNIYKSYNGVPILKGINLTVNEGDVISIIGKSGSGKTTLLRCLNLLVEPDNGQIFFLDEEITHKKANINKIRENMGMVFQSFNLFNNLNVLENCTLALQTVLKLPKEKAIERALYYLEKVGMKEFKNNNPNNLSGGQQQRVAIARALCMEPKLMLFDEPTSALDPLLIDEVLSVIKGLANEGMTMIIVTHEMKFAYDISTKIIFMHEGIIAESGTPQDIFFSPIKKETQDFVKLIKSQSFI